MSRPRRRAGTDAESSLPEQKAKAPQDLGTPTTPMALRILVVDDNPVDRKLTAAQLAAEGAEVIEVSSVQEAMGLLDLAQVDAVVSDVYMPGQDGFVLCQRLRAHPRGRDLPVILLSAVYPAEDMARVALEAGADAMLTRPVDVEELMAVIQHAVLLPHAAELGTPLTWGRRDLPRDASER